MQGVAEGDPNGVEGGHSGLMDGRSIPVDLHRANVHVEEGDLSDESCSDEHDPDQHIIAITLVIIHFEFTERQHILVQYSIDEGDAKGFGYEFLFITISTIVGHDQRISECHQDHDEEDQEVEAHGQAETRGALIINVQSKDFIFHHPQKLIF
mgnify:CR=1 FL=1